MTQVLRWYIMMNHDAVILGRHRGRCCYNTVNFLINIHKRHPIGRPSGRAMGCLLWVQPLLDVVPDFLQLFMQYLTTLDCVLTALNCIVFHKYISVFKHMSVSKISVIIITGAIEGTANLSTGSIFFLNINSFHYGVHRECIFSSGIEPIQWTLSQHCG